MIKLMDRPVPWGMRYSLREVIDRAWRLHFVWWLLAVIPRGVKYYVIVQAAVEDNPGNPGRRTAEQMLKRLERNRDVRAYLEEQP